MSRPLSKSRRISEKRRFRKHQAKYSIFQAANTPALILASVLANQLILSTATANPGQVCQATSLSWMEGPYRCSAQGGAAIPGRKISLTDQSAPNGGEAVFLCATGKWRVQAGASCGPIQALPEPGDAQIARLDDLPPVDDSGGYLGTTPLPGTTMLEPMDPEYAKRVHKAMDLGAKAVDPEPRWFATSVSPAAAVMPPGQTVELNIHKSDYAGVDYAPVRSGDLSLKVVWQREDGSLVDMPDAVSWIAAGKLSVQAPIGQGVGRMIVSLMPGSTDAAVRAKTQRWAGLFAGEVLGVAPSAIDLASAGELTWPRERVSTTRFGFEDFRDALLAYETSRSEEDGELAFPVVIKGADPIAVGQLVDLRYQGLPMGGTVRASTTRGDEQMLTIEWAPAAAYRFAKNNPQDLIDKGLAPEFPFYTFSVNSDPARDTRTMGDFGPKPAQFGKLSRAAAPSSTARTATSKEPGSFDNCSFGKGRAGGGFTVTFLPLFDFKEGDHGFHARVSVAGAGEIECKYSFDADGLGATKLASTAIALATSAPMGLLVGKDLRPAPYGEIKAKLSVDADLNGVYGIQFGASTKKGSYGYAVGGLGNNGGGFDPGHPLKGIAVDVAASIGGEMGLKAKLQPSLSSGAVGAVMMLATFLRDKREDNSFELKAYASAGAKATIPNIASVYQRGKGSNVKESLSGGVAFKIPKAVADAMERVKGLQSGNISLSNSFKAEWTVLTRSLEMKIKAGAQQNHATGTVPYQIAPAAEAAVKAGNTYGEPGSFGTVGSKGQVSTDLVSLQGLVAPKNQEASYFGAIAKVGTQIWSSMDDCARETQTAPIIAGVDGLWGKSEPITVCNKLSGFYRLAYNHPTAGFRMICPSYYYGAWAKCAPSGKPMNLYSPGSPPVIQLLRNDGRGTCSFNIYSVDSQGRPSLLWLSYDYQQIVVPCSSAPFAYAVTHDDMTPYR